MAAITQLEQLDMNCFLMTFEYIVTAVRHSTYVVKHHFAMHNKCEDHIPVYFEIMISPMTVERPWQRRIAKYNRNY